MKYKVFLLLLVGLVMAHPVVAQSWQWGARGGSWGNSSTDDNEFVKDMATDRNGNLYVLTNTGDTSGIDINGMPKKGFGGEDIVLASFKCDGTLRWVKFFGTAEYDDGGGALCTDQLDGVYVAAHMFRGPQKKPIYIDGDKTINSSDEKKLYFIKYDTSGHLKWVRAPQPDTVTAAQQAGTIDMDVDSAGNVFALCQLPPGIYENSFVATPTFTAQGHDYQDCILKYDRNGNFQGGLAFDTKGCYGARMVRDSKTKHYYIAGNSNNPIPMGNTSIAHNSGYVACFSEEGGFCKYLWDIQSYDTKIYGNPIFDVSGNIYLAGLIRSPSTSYPNANFNGFVAQPYPNISNGAPFIIKIDSNKKNMWATYAIINGVTLVGGISIRNSGEIILGGSFPGLLAWPNYTKDTLYYPPNSGYHPFITRFNTQTGKILGVDKLETDKQNAYADEIIADGRNNIYIGGELAGKLTVNGNDMYNVGGRNDWAIAKYGHNNCNCTNIPEPSFTYNKPSLNNLNFSYTGSTYSTIEWDFDDGTTSNQASPSHVYAKDGVYTVCVKVTNSCGDNTYCQILDTWPVGINDVTSSDNIHVYPNPANDILYISGHTPGTTITLYDVIGKKLYQGVSTTTKESIHINNFLAGTYIIQLTDKSGKKTTKRMVKQ
ncbi:MAG: T9SS type A sorting domain-containing protein [Chitinophagales bacterium]|nr:T9SS type A sorting domain-containing protein [Chitinophagales bacterium]